jgi:hypothetical protein
MLSAMIRCCGQRVDVVLDFALHFRPGDPSEWIAILAVVGALAALFIFLWLRKGSVVDFLDPETLKTPPERAMDAFNETMAVSRKLGHLAHAVIWGIFAFLSGLGAALVLSMTVLGAVVGSFTATEVGVGALVSLGLGLATWFFVYASRDELRTGRAPQGPRALPAIREHTRGNTLGK